MHHIIPLLVGGVVGLVIGSFRGLSHPPSPPTNRRHEPSTAGFHRWITARQLIKKLNGETNKRRGWRILGGTQAGTPSAIHNEVVLVLHLREAGRKPRKTTRRTVKTKGLEVGDRNPQLTNCLVDGEMQSEWTR